MSSDPEIIEAVTARLLGLKCVICNKPTVAYRCDCQQCRGDAYFCGNCAVPEDPKGNYVLLTTPRKWSTP